jgi:parallel beta helix pectate lyase-like protein
LPSVSGIPIVGVTIVNGTITKIRGKAIVLGSSGTASGLQLIHNNGDGLRCTSSCLVTNNVITGNTGTGLSFSDSTSGYQNNIISGNGATVVGGTSLTHNVCDGSIC